jgi:hypothetical protein
LWVALGGGELRAVGGAAVLAGAVGVVHAHHLRQVRAAAGATTSYAAMLGVLAAAVCMAVGVVVLEQGGAARPGVVFACGAMPLFLPYVNGWIMDGAMFDHGAGLAVAWCVGCSMPLYMIVGVAPAPQQWAPTTVACVAHTACRMVQDTAFILQGVAALQELNARPVPVLRYVAPPLPPHP